MPSSRFERVKAKHRSLAHLLEQMMGYVHKQVHDGATFVIPKLAAAMLNLSEGEAYVLLKILADEGVLHQQYNVYCGSQGMLIGSADSADQLDEIPYCDFCDTQHEPYQLSLKIAFRPTAQEGTHLAA